MLVSLKATVWRHLIALCRELSNQVRWLSHDPPGVLGRSGEGKKQDGGLDVGGLVPGLRGQGCSHPGPGGGSWGQGWDTELSLRRTGPRSSWDWCEGGGWWGQTQPQSFRSGLGGGADSEGSSTPRVVGRCIGKEAAAALQLQVAWRGGVGGEARESSYAQVQCDTSLRRWWGWHGDAAQQCCSPSTDLLTQTAWAGASHVACTCGVIRSPPNGFGRLESPAWSPPKQDSGGSRE